MRKGISTGLGFLLFFALGTPLMIAATEFYVAMTCERTIWLSADLCIRFKGNSFFVNTGRFGYGR
jgi:hypothetical protein